MISALLRELLGTALPAALVAWAFARRVGGPALRGAMGRLTVASLVVGFVATAVAAAATFPEWPLPRGAGRTWALVARIAIAIVVALALRPRRGHASGGSASVPPASPLSAPVPRGLSRALALATGLAVAAAFTAFCVRSVKFPDGEWDAYGVWNVRARMMVRAPGEPGIVFSPAMAMSHPDYPLLLPGLVASGWEVRDGTPLVPITVAALGFLACVGAVASGAGHVRGSSAARLGVLLLLASPLVAKIAAWQYADVWTGAFLALVVAWLAAGEREGPAGARGAVALAGACVSLTAWTKNEGWLYVVALLAALAARPPASLPRSTAISHFLLGAAPILGAALAFKAFLAPPNDLVDGAAKGAGLTPLFDPARWSVILAAFAREPFRTSHWNLVMPLVLLALLWPRRLGRAAASVMPACAIALVLAVAGYASVYALTPMPLEWHLSSSLHRVLLQLWPALCMTTAWRWAGAADGWARAARPALPARDG